jgi:hypothetical protein
MAFEIFLHARSEFLILTWGTMLNEISKLKSSNNLIGCMGVSKQIDNQSAHCVLKLQGLTVFTIQIIIQMKFQKL